jgi:hypothetical protein
MNADIDLIRRLGLASKGLSVVATTRRDGSVHASLVNAGVLDNPLTGSPSVGLVVRSAAVKLALMRRSGRANVVFHSGWEWVAAEGAVTIVGHDDVPEGFDLSLLPALLRDIFKAAGGTHNDWAEFDRVMADERRAGVFVALDRITTNG